MYISTIMLRLLGQDKLKSIFLSICLALGMLIGMMFISQSYEAWYSYFNYKESIDYDHIVVVQVEENEMKLNEYYDIYETINSVDEIIPYREYITNLVTYKEKIMTGVSVIGTSEAFQSVFGDFGDIYGNWINSEYDCVIGKKIAKRFHINIGDTISINNYDYNVVGINNINVYKDFIFTDFSLGSRRFDSISIFDKSTYTAGFNYLKQPQLYYIILKEKVEDNHISMIKDFILERYNIANVYKGRELVISQKNNLYSGWGMSITISIISLLYGVINMHNIEKFYYLKRKKIYGILLAHGATKKQIFLAIYIESGIITIISSIILYFATYLLSISKINDRIAMRVDIYILIIIFLIGQVYSLLYSWVNTKSLHKQSIRTIF